MLKNFRRAMAGHLLGLFFVLALLVTLEWDENTEPDLAGYKIYYDIDSGEPYTGTGAIQGSSPIILVLADDLNPTPGVFESIVTFLSGFFYRFVVTAYDDQGRESDYSNEVKLRPCLENIQRQ